MNRTRLMAAPALALAAALITPAFIGAAASASTGASWSIQPTPNPHGTAFSGLNGVSCPSATACTAAGDYQTSSGARKTLAERYGT